MHKENNHIPKRKRLACLAFVVLPCYLLNREVRVVGKIFKIHTHTHTQYIRGDAQVGAGNAERRHWSAATASTTSPSGTHPCAQAIIVNDKVTIEVIIVLN